MCGAGSIRRSSTSCPYTLRGEVRGASGFWRTQRFLVTTAASTRRPCPLTGSRGAGISNGFMERASGTDLAFFDPDTGIEPASAKGPKYVHWHELDRASSQGHSLLIYQHFPRGERHAPFIKDKAEQLGRLANAHEILVFHDHAVAFFLVCQREHSDRIRQAKAEIEANWKDRITMRAFSQAPPALAMAPK